MIHVKLLVICILVNVIRTQSKNYCDICVNHTLCKYPIHGASSQCSGYDSMCKLSNDDIKDILDKINERRNFVALGLSRHLPQAANMRKVFWSEELSKVAQRWADQCDPSLRPDKEDECRDLEGIKVGQNIASVPGPAPGLHVKSFIDMWFMQSLRLFGSVSYYNATLNRNTNYFTQLIWAEAEIVGCGRARFSLNINNNNSIIERLVCNFAPKGNIQRKPIYALGLPATQCAQNMVPDMRYTGLCTSQFDKKDKEKPRNHTEPITSSMLRILALSNNSVIDPIGSNLKQNSPGHNRTNDHLRNQKTRQVLNNSMGDHLGAHQKRKKLPFISRRKINRNDPNRGYAMMFPHGFEQYNNYFRKNSPSKYDTTRTANTHLQYSEHNLCTRQFTENCEDPNTCSIKQCTRRHKLMAPSTTPNCKLPEMTTRSRLNNPRAMCPCNPQSTAYTPPSNRCNCNMNNVCPDLTNYCNNLRRQGSNPLENSNAPPQSNCNISNTEQRNVQTTENTAMHLKVNPWIPKNEDNKIMLKHKDYDDVTNRIEYHTPTERHIDHSYNAYDINERKRRKPENQLNLKPFWQVEEFISMNPTQLKALRYTTLPNKRNKKIRPLKISEHPLNIEPITLKIKPKEFTNNRNLVTEKYLSFDELMRLRKLSTVNEELNARRANVMREGTTPTPTTSVYTTNTPFIRKKYCTRILTCTWTAPVFTLPGGAPAGGGGGAGGGGVAGTRTPPGYVEGCTRTSTCTRDFMDRNKLPTKPDEGSGEEDEDYCERRSLDTQRRDNDEKESFEEREESNVDENKKVTIYPYTLLEPNTKSYNFVEVTKSDTSETCECNENKRRKRRDLEPTRNPLNQKQTNKQKKDESRDRKELSYGDLYYLILQKIIKTWQSSGHSSKRCLCNIGSTTQNCFIFMIFAILFNFIVM